MPYLLRTRFLISLCSLWLIFAAANVLTAQPVDELDQLQSQLKQLQSRINSIQDKADPFGQRARSVGRQRVAPPTPKDDGTLIIRFYDLSDIFSVAPQYPARVPDDLVGSSGDIFPIASASGGSLGGGGFGGGGGGVFNMPPSFSRQQQALSAARVSVDTLINAITETVSPEDWEDEDGEATINVLGNTLLISATDSMHEQIANLLNLIREHWGKLKTVSVQAYWIKSDPNQVRELLRGTEENRTVGKVETTKWQSFFEKANQDKRIVYSASISGHNGQTLNTVSGRQRMLVVDAEPLYSFTGTREEIDEEDVEHIDKSVSGMRPIRSPFQEGAALQVSPLATRGGNFVILDLHTRVNEMIKDDPAIDPQKIVARSRTGEDISVPLDNAKYVSYRLSTTIRCPKDEVILAGGMTFDSKQEDNQPNLYLFVRTRIHTIEEDQVEVEIGGRRSEVGN